jgi:predicted unusual protein kinase regulating ubiquinone biosynthesis (AarF/ABC1/UbiB family)
VQRAPSGRVALGRVAPLLEVIGVDVGTDPAFEPIEEATVSRVAKGFDEFDAEPIAVRAAAQTHRGVAEGVPVAIRIRRPGLDRSVRNDLALLDTLALPLGAAMPKADAAALLRSVRQQLLDELDFEHEASTHRRVARVLRGVDGLVVPAVRSELCAEDVFVTELLEGQTLAGGAQPEDPAAVARTLVAAHVAAARAGLALLDARPGHVVVLAEGRIGLLGIGMARPVGRDRVEHLLDALAALRAADEAAFANAMASARLPTAAYGVAQSALGPLVVGAARLDGAALRRILRGAVPALGLAAQAEPHPDDPHLARAAGQLLATLAPLAVTADWPELVAASS